VIESVQSSSGRDCGTVDYTWATGDLRPLACVEWSITYDTSQSFSGCVVNDVNFKQDVYFPQWTSPPTVITQDLDWWRQFVEVIRKHEAGHVDINTQWLPAFRSRMDGQSCSTIDTTGADTRDEIKAAQEAYDKEQYSLQKFPRRPD
jgi:predicted secreted Zn-dependent protease